MYKPVKYRLWPALYAALYLLAGTECAAYSLSHMVADLERPYIYAIDQGLSGEADTLLFVSVESEQVVKKMPIGDDVTDLAIHYGDGRLYVTNWGHDSTRVVDLETQTELPPFRLGPHVYKLNAGKLDRIYYEEGGHYIHVKIVRTSDGRLLGQFPQELRNGDAEIDATGRFYYHCDNNSSAASLHKFDLATDSPVKVDGSFQYSGGSRNLVLCGDGSRMFWQGYVFDADLNERGNLGAEIYATTLHGDLAFGANSVFDTHTGDAVYTLPATTTVLTVSGDQSKLFLYDQSRGDIVVIPMSEIAELPGPGLNPDPEDGATVIPPLVRLAWDIEPFAFEYRLYFADDEISVADADTNSPEYLGTVTETKIPLAAALKLGSTYFWRVDVVNFSDVTLGEVWSFTVAPLLVEPSSIGLRMVTVQPPLTIELPLTSGGTSVPWSVAEPASWLNLSHTSGMTPDVLTLTIDSRAVAIGDYSAVLEFTSGSFDFGVPVGLEVFEMELNQMLTDYERPYIYALHPGSGSFEDASLLFINTVAEAVELVLPIGTNPTDMSINYGEERLYVTNWLRNVTRVVDLKAKTELEPLNLGEDVYRLNAGRAGRIYTEWRYGWIRASIFNTVDGQMVGRLPGALKEGDGEIDSAGTFYYHCENTSSRSQVHKFDISTDSPVRVAYGPEKPHGSPVMFLSRDGSRLFWKGLVFDADLNELGFIAGQIFAATFHGDLAFGSSSVFNSYTGDVVYTLPTTTNVMAISGDQTKLFLYDEDRGGITVIPMSEIAAVNTVVEPETLYMAMAHSVEPMELTAYLGDFHPGYSASDVNTVSLSINFDVPITSSTSLPSHPEFEGEVLQLTFPATEFILDYSMVLDVSSRSYTISGNYEDGMPLAATGTFTMVGHRSGDVNLDGMIDIADVTYLIRYIFAGATAPSVHAIADMNKDSTANISDVCYLITYIFAGGPPPRSWRLDPEAENSNAAK